MAKYTDWCRQPPNMVYICVYTFTFPDIYITCKYLVVK